MYLTQALHRLLQRNPDVPLTVCGDRVRTVRESVERTARLAGALRDLGIRPGDRVGILAFNSDRYHEYLMACWWIGAAVNPINIRWAPPEIRYCLEQSGTRCLFVDDAFLPVVDGLRDVLDTVVHCGEQPAPDGLLPYETLLASTDPVEDGRFGGDTLAGVFYTGGTTGFPKGVMLSHANMMVSALGSQACEPIAVAGGRMLHAAPLFHSAALVAWNIQTLVGGTHVFTPSFEPVAVLKAVQDHAVSTSMLPPVMIQLLVDHPDRGAYDLSSFRSFLYGASPMPEALLRRAMAAFPSARFLQAYGMTEVAPVATLLTGADHIEGTRLRSGGRAAPHSEIRIVGADGAELPAGQVGEIAVRGGHVMSGYWNKPDETAEVLRDGWLHTGDGGYLDADGYLYIVDRIKDMIVTGGENVYSTEVENALAQHPAVASCAVIGVPDDIYGERVHAVVVLKPGADTSGGELRDHCKTLIAGYKAPRTTEFVARLPLSPAGKILKRELRKPHWKGRERSVG
ncbi:Long-chain-fatty-acid--CoA ligase FadD13 [Streptomyces sp. YIM 130001]|uniref:acyl-CoA synthetase n=1 Tax=Streptomyces sp. YIM 130001 TaxID=2259644 RepID=UPI000E65C4E6|nr:long-chain fatty acid--CoA ligase [Streptomyces sp. YIM 130001]RII14228.1 Long-chain-fatty-acid--CoA ligase FadD13 [Streptomyces sp. YIM 130001]